MRSDSNMATITLKDVPEELCSLLKQRAAGNRRSLSQEVLCCIERFVGFSPKLENREWAEASKETLLKVWDNPEDDVYNELI